MLEIARHFRDDLAKLDHKATFALVYAAIGLTCISYLRDPQYLRSILSNTRLSEIGNEAVNATNNNLYGLAWWAAVSVTFYFVIPALYVKFIQRRDLTEVGFRHRIEPGFLQVVGVSMLIMLPLVYLMSLTSGFSTKYPFLHIYNGSPYLSWTLVAWELLYFAQFFGLEFFFRGLLVQSLKPSMGPYAILAMMVPYTMIHFQKPMPEAFAAIFAGLFLGWISYRNGTIWLGLVLHCTVALSMDILALYNKGLLF